MSPRDRPKSGLATFGSAGLLSIDSAGLFCSARCPGTLVLQAYDLARSFRDGGLPVVGGFHAPMERDCLDLLLRGTQPVVLCLARSLERMRIPVAWQPAIDARRMLLVSQFPEGVRRVTAATAEQRNQLVADLAKALMVIHAVPNSHTMALCERALAAGKPVFALDSPHNAGLEQIGVRLISPSDVSPLKEALDE